MHRRTNSRHCCSMASASPATSSRRVSSCRPVSSGALRSRASASQRGVVAARRTAHGARRRGMCARARPARAPSRGRWRRAVRNASIAADSTARDAMYSDARRDVMRHSCATPSAGRAFSGAGAARSDDRVPFARRTDQSADVLRDGHFDVSARCRPGPDRLAEIAPGVLWVLALLSTLLSLDTLFRRDFDDGTLEQMVLNVDPLFVGVLAKVFVALAGDRLAAHVAVADRRADVVPAAVLRCRR